MPRLLSLVSRPVAVGVLDRAVIADSSLKRLIGKRKNEKTAIVSTCIWLPPAEYCRPTRPDCRQANQLIGFAINRRSSRSFLLGVNRRGNFHLKWQRAYWLFEKV
jgi:hypothetical protein